METPGSLLEALRVESDGVAWQTLCDLYSPMMRNWLSRNGASQSDVEDLVQEVLMVVVRKIPEFQREPRTGAFRRWLKNITVNCLREYRRRMKKQDIARGGTEFHLMIEQLADVDSNLSKLWDREYEESVSRYLLSKIRNQFSKKTLQAFQRFALDGLSADEVAGELGMTPNAVFIAKSRVMSSLREFGRGLID